MKKATELLPLSPMQAAMANATVLTNEAQAHVIQFAWLLKGQLDQPALYRALEKLLETQPSLRSQVVVHNGIYFQTTVEHASLSVEEIPLDTYEEGIPEEFITRFLTRERLRGFDLTKELPVRFQFMRFSAYTCALLVTVHHCFFDGPSAEIFEEMLLRFYMQELQLENAPRSEKVAPYLALKQEECQTFEQGLQKHKLFWRNQLVGGLPQLSFTDFPARQHADDACLNVPGHLDMETWECLKQFARQQETTPFVVLLALYAAFLAARTGQKDIVVGVPVNTRKTATHFHTIGCFLTMLPVRIQLAETMSFRDVLATTQYVWKEVLQHQEVAYEDLLVLAQEMATRQNQCSRVNLVLNYLRNPFRSYHIDHLVIEPVEIQQTITNFDLILDVFNMQKTADCVWRFARSSFSEQSAEMLVHQFSALVSRVLEDPGRVVSPELLWEEKQSQIWETINREASVCEQQLSLVRGFHQAARRYADSTAVLMENQRWTYARLEQDSVCLSRYLRDTIGIQPGQPVGILMERSYLAIVSMLAILRCGCPYVPLDPKYPATRLACMCEVSGASCLLTVQNLPHQALPETLSIVEIHPDLLSHMERAADLEHDHAIMENELATILFTSGSTGVPKGVELRHAGIARLALPTAEVNITPEDRVLHFASLSFDASLFEIWGTLLNGATMVIIPEGNEALPVLGNRLHEAHVTVAWLTASLFNYLVDEHVETFKELRMVLTGGEQLSSRHVARFLQAFPAIDLINGYGPTENTTFTCFYTITGVEPQQALIPVGKPLRGTSVYVMDSSYHILPVGVIGELYIGGEGLFAGYRGCPDETAERLVPDPFHPGRTLYKSGDLAKILPTGDIEILGREDDLVKVRGFRIELAEVNQAFHRLAGIAQAVTCVNEDHLLTTYLLVSSEVQTDPLQLQRKYRADIAEYLPPHAIPDLIKIVDSIPVTLNGKVDLEALPAHVQETKDEDRQEIRLSPVGQTLREIWVQILACDHIQPEDDFFVLGGHSLRAARLIHLVEREYAVLFSLKDVFQKRTLSGMTQLIEERLMESSQTHKPDHIEPQGNIHHLALLPTQQALWVAAQVNAESSESNVNIAKLMCGELDLAAFEAALNFVIKKHAALRAHFELRNDHLIQIIEPYNHYSLPCIDLSTLEKDGQERRLQQLLHEHASQRFDLEVGPLFTSSLFRLAPQRYAWIMVMHHIITDGWSQEMLLKDMARSYNATLAGQPVPDENALSDYADAITAVTALHGSEKETLALSYWEEQLQAILRSSFPTERPEKMDKHSEVFKFGFGDDLAQEVREFQKRTGSSIFSILLAAFVALLYRSTGNQIQVVGMPMANRTTPQSLEVMGCFTNPVALSFRISPEQSFIELLQTVQKGVLDAYEHQECPFSMLADRLRKYTHLENPWSLIDIWFNVVPYGNEALSLDKLKISYLFAGTSTSKFKLNWTVNISPLAMTGLVEYRDHCLEQQKIEQMSKDYLRLLLLALRRADEQVSALLQQIK